MISLGPIQDDEGGIDWGESGEAPIEIEVLDGGTDCKYFLFCFVRSN